MAKEIYGVNPEAQVTPLMVRDAIIECFRQAHCADSGINSDDKKINLLYCKAIVEKAFKDSDGDFDHPTKDSILECLKNLVEFSKNFRDPAVINQHYTEIMKLVDKLK